MPVRALFAQEATAATERAEPSLEGAFNDWSLYVMQ
jgi:hypothetical protein